MRRGKVGRWLGKFELGKVGNGDRGKDPGRMVVPRRKLGTLRLLVLLRMRRWFRFVN